MQYKDKETGKTYYVEYTSALAEELEAVRNKQCAHEFRYAEWILANGSSRIVPQCQICGTKQQAVAKGKIDPSLIIPHNEEIISRYEAQKKQAEELILQKHFLLQQAGKSRHSDDYQTHIASPAWKATRLKVLKRANYICEGCLEEEATQVHHKHYDDLGNEFIFDLLALCEYCHARLHRIEDDEVKSDDLKLAETMSELNVEAEIHRLECQCRFGGGGGLRPQCGKFNMPVRLAIEPGGPCGPDRDGHEELR